MNRGFTLIELLATISVTGLLSALMLAGIQRTREYAALGQCANNLKMLVAANTLYAAEHGHFVAAAEDIHGPNLTRWHGRRASASEPFDGLTGPLSPYYGHSHGIRRCAAFPNSGPVDVANEFEKACGGYGYNDRGVGSRAYINGYTAAATRKGIPATRLRAPSRTIMFADTAFPQPYGSPTHVIEYSFAEAYHFVSRDSNGNIRESGTAMPSIHFRHGGRANIAWSDGHVTALPMATEYSGAFTEMGIGWPGEPNNDMFRPF